jgi:carboxypeptidase Q
MLVSRSLCALGVGVLTVVPAFAQTPAVAPSADVLAAASALRDAALKDNEAYAIVRALTVEVGPRSAGSEGDRAAVAWALTQMHDLGLEGVHAESVSVPHWERGTAEARIVEPFPQPLAAVALGGSVGTDESGLEAPVIAVADLDELAKLPEGAVRGTIVYFAARMQRTKDGAGYVKAVRARTSGPAAAARRGAVGMLMRSAGTSDARFPHTGTTVYDPNVPPIPALALAQPDADLLEQELANGSPVVVRMRVTARNLPPARSANVIGEVPGSGDGIVLLAAHLDSWDLGTGAIDDGAGVGIVLAAAHLIAQRGEKLERTLRVVLYANEEFGLSGAKAYASAHADELERHTLGLESDSGAGRVWRIDSRVGDSALSIVDAIGTVLTPLGVDRGGNEAQGGADLGPLRDAGVPVLDLQQDATRYFDFHHTADDTLDKIERSDYDQVVAAFTATAYVAAAVKADFGRLPPAVSTSP